MFALPRRKSSLDTVINGLLERMTKVDVESDTYAKMIDQLAKLTKLKESYSPKPISRDTMLIVAGNLAGIIIIIGYERVHVIATKAIGFVIRAR